MPMLFARCLLSGVWQLVRSLTPTMFFTQVVTLCNPCSFFGTYNMLHEQSNPMGRLGRLHAAFIDFKQAYDTIPRDALWKHLRRTRMPAPLLSVIQDMYNRDEYVLKDGDKTIRGVKQGCPLSPLLFSLYIKILTTLLREYQGLSLEPRVCTSHTCCMQMI